MRIAIGLAIVSCEVLLRFPEGPQIRGKYREMSTMTNATHCPNLNLSNRRAAMIHAALTALELAVLRDLCRQLPFEAQAALERQINGLSVVSRKNTGAGFYTHFAVEGETTPPINVDVKGYHVSATIDNIEDALGFILWLKDG